MWKRKEKTEEKKHIIKRSLSIQNICLAEWCKMLLGFLFKPICFPKNGENKLFPQTWIGFLEVKTFLPFLIRHMFPTSYIHLVINYLVRWPQYNGKENILNSHSSPSFLATLEQSHLYFFSFISIIFTKKNKVKTVIKLKEMSMYCIKCHSWKSISNF